VIGSCGIDAALPSTGAAAPRHFVLTARALRGIGRDADHHLMGLWEARMAKADWGTKRTCPNCGARYYDLHHDPIVCPKCGAAFDPEALLKTRRVRVVAPVPEVAETAVEEEIDAELEGGGEAEGAEEGEEEVAVEGEEEEEEEVLEDASELGEDEDDMAEVIENVEDEEER
jgi:uncharacterized protein (TIGR02300 family)